MAGLERKHHESGRLPARKMRCPQHHDAPAAVLLCSDSLLIAFVSWNPLLPDWPRFSSRCETGTRTLVESLDLTLEPGEVLGILGANGAGKSTLLTVLAGLADPAQGQVTLDGHALDRLPPLTRAQHIGLLAAGRRRRILRQRGRLRRARALPV